jgi:hypothetical protein
LTTRNGNYCNFAIELPSFQNALNGADIALHTVRGKVFPCIETRFVKENSLLERALFREVICQACVRGGQSTAELISFIVDAGIENVRDAKSFQDINDNVHQTTMESIETYCKRKHINNEEKMLNAMVSSYEGRVRGGEVEERKQRS